MGSEAELRLTELPSAECAEEGGGMHPSKHPRDVLASCF